MEFYVLQLVAFDPQMIISTYSFIYLFIQQVFMDPRK